MSGTTCVECWAQWQSVSVTVLLLLMVVVGTGVVVSRGGTKRSVAMGIVRILVNYMQTVRHKHQTCVVAHAWVCWLLTCGVAAQNYIIGEFRARGPALLMNLMGFASVGDGLSLGFFPVQVCSV